MNKNIVKMISMTSKYAHPHINTNGILINDKKAEELITSGLGTLIVSIDAVTQKVYEKYRVGGQVNEVINNIIKLKEINEYYNNPVKILPQFIVFDHNYDEVNEFKDFCKKLNLTPIFKKPYIRFGAVKESNDKNFQRKKYMSKEEHLDAISQCPHATCTMTITADGKLLLCAQHYNGEWPIGNILNKNSTVENLCNDSFYKEVRKQRIMKKCPPEICIKKCMIYNPGYPV